jgi:hypothetical protein
MPRQESHEKTKQSLSPGKLKTPKHAAPESTAHFESSKIKTPGACRARKVTKKQSNV